jgi:UDP-3-O-[3-hydroxymyristoyl] N-acetylglucosamine deacetylase
LSLPVRNDHHQKTTVAPAIIAGVGVHTGDRVRLAGQAVTVLRGQLLATP